MTANRRQKQNTGNSLIKFLLVVIIIVCIAIIFRMTVWNKLKQKAVNYATSVAIEQVAGSYGMSVTSEEVQQVLDSMDAEDQEKLNSLIEEKVTSETISDVTSYIQSGDIQGAQQYVEENLSAEDVQQLEDLYNKYLSDQYGPLPEH